MDRWCALDLGRLCYCWCISHFSEEEIFSTEVNLVNVKTLPDVASLVMSKREIHVDDAMADPRRASLLRIRPVYDSGIKQRYMPLLFYPKLCACQIFTAHRALLHQCYRFCSHSNVFSVFGELFLPRIRFSPLNMKINEIHEAH